VTIKKGAQEVSSDIDTHSLNNFSVVRNSHAQICSFSESFVRGETQADLELGHNEIQQHTILISEEANEYIDLQKVPLQGLTQLCDITSVTPEDIQPDTMIDFDAMEWICCTPETHDITEEDLKVVKEVDKDRRIRGLAILECPCSLGLDGERLGYCDVHDIIADHNSILDTDLSSRGKKSPSETRKKCDVLDKEWGTSAESDSTPALCENRLILDVELANLNLNNDYISSPNKVIQTDMEDRLDPSLNVRSSPNDETEQGADLRTASFDCNLLPAADPLPNHSINNVNALSLVKEDLVLDKNSCEDEMNSRISSISQSQEHVHPNAVDISISPNLGDIRNDTITTRRLSKSETSLHMVSLRRGLEEYGKSPLHSYPSFFEFEVSHNSPFVSRKLDQPFENGVKCMADKVSFEESMDDSSVVILNSEKLRADNKIENMNKNRLFYSYSSDDRSNENKPNEVIHLTCGECLDDDADEILNNEMGVDEEKNINTKSSIFNKNDLASGTHFTGNEETLSGENRKSEVLNDSWYHLSKCSPGDLGKINMEYGEVDAEKTWETSNKIKKELKKSSSVTSERSVGTNVRQVRFSQQSSNGRFSTTSSKHDDDSYMVREYMNTIKDKQFQLKKLLQRGFQSLEGVNVMLAMSEAIQQKFGELIVHNQEYSFRHNFENSLWKLAFYSIIAKFRLFLEDKDVPHGAIQKIGVLYWDFLQNGIQFLDAIIVQLQKQADFDLSSYLKDPIKISSCNKQVKFALRSCHLLLIFMGDLERYVSQFLQEDDYHNAKRYYKQAQILTPKNGKSYNQLAVIAVVTKHKLDAVYYYARSLQVSIPFLTAKDRLTAIFQEIHKKASKLKQTRIKRMSNSSISKVSSSTHTLEASHNCKGNYEQNKTLSVDCTNSYLCNKNVIDPDSYDRNTFVLNTSCQNDMDHLRDEVWIFCRKGMKVFKVMLTKQNEIIDLTPKSVAETQEASKMEDSKSVKFSLNEINRTYMILFLFVHCKLYTNIGLEEFTYIHQETLSDLTTLLCYPKASSIRKENLLKCIVINIFSVHNIMEKNGHEDVIPNTALDLAISFGMDMIGVLCKHCVEVLDEDEKQFLKIDQFLPAIRVWLKWLITHSELVKKSSVSSMFDIWAEVCEFFNRISSLPRDGGIMLITEGRENSYLEEDLMMAGLKSLNNTLLFCSPKEGFEKKAVSDLRMQNMIELVKQLEECGNLPFSYDSSACRYKPVLSTCTSSASPVKKVKDLDVQDEIYILDDVIIEDDDEEEGLGDMSHVNELKTQKAALTKQIQESQFAHDAAMAVLESHRLQGRHLSENCPTFLVADTNCYIDHLESIYSILRSQDFTLVVPLVVINELDGLKKGVYFDASKFHEHQRKVQESAQLAINFLEDGFCQGSTNLRAITSNGSELDTILFRAEEFSRDRGTNDDIILSCCLKYCKECKIDTLDATGVIYREVVLLTSDRNLRLKAHSRVVPTVDIVTFMKMARFV